MSNPEHEQIIRHGYAVAEAMDVPGFVNAFTPDGTFTDEAFGNVFTGSKELEEDDELPATIQPSDGLLDPGGSRRGRVCALTHGCVPHFRVRSCGVVTCQV